MNTVLNKLKFIDNLSCVIHSALLMFSLARVCYIMYVIKHPEIAVIIRCVYSFQSSLVYV